MLFRPSVLAVASAIFAMAFSPSLSVQAHLGKRE
jgi:hypothetical protein